MNVIELYVVGDVDVDFVSSKSVENLFNVVCSSAVQQWQLSHCHYTRRYIQTS